MKRYAVFLEDGSGGMYDFVAAFETCQEADDFAENTAFKSYYVEDMASYLNQPSPPIPTPADKIAAYKAAEDREKACLEAMTPLQREVYLSARYLRRSLAKGLYSNED